MLEAAVAHARGETEEERAQHPDPAAEHGERLGDLAAFKVEEADRRAKTRRDPQDPTTNKPGRKQKFRGGLNQLAHPPGLAERSSEARMRIEIPPDFHIFRILIQS